MNELSMKVYDKHSLTIAASGPGTAVALVHNREYHPGDRIGIEIKDPGTFVEIRFDDSMLPAIVYINEHAVSFQIPQGRAKTVYSPKSFQGDRHLITARIISEREANMRRNLALNPYDTHEVTGIFPHAYANVETRGESVFAARNVIDGIWANRSHGAYPYQSWGINQRQDAELTVDLGVECDIDEIKLVTRADFPHDNYWEAATLQFSDGSEVEFPLSKTGQEQILRTEMVSREVTIKDLKISDEPSPFPALTQIEIWGTPTFVRT